MWYKSSSDAITFKAPLEKEEETVFHILKCGDITPVTSSSLSAKDKYCGILTDFLGVTIQNGGDDIIIIDNNLVIHVDEIVIIFTEKDMEKVMEVLQDDN